MNEKVDDGYRKNILKETVVLWSKITVIISSKEIVINV